MLENTTSIEDVTDQSLMEITHALHQLTLADSMLNCQVCNEALSDGNEIVCHLQCSAGKTSYELGQIRCSAHSDGMESLLRLGIEELLVECQIGRCSDQATQQSWAALIEPEIRAISPATTATTQRVQTTPTNDTSTPKQQSSESEPQTGGIGTHQESHDDSSVTIVGDTGLQATPLNHWKQTLTKEGSP